MKSQKVNQNLKMVFLLIFGLILAVIFAYHLAYFGRIYPGVEVAGEELGNKTKAEAAKILVEEIQNRKPKEILINSSAKTWSLSLSELELSYEVDKSLDSAYSVGRNKNPLKAYREKWQAWTKGINLPLAFSFNQSALEKKLEEISLTVFIPPIDPQLKVLEKRLSDQGSRIVINPGKEGQEVNLSSLRENINFNLSFLKKEPLPLPLIYTSPKIALQELEKTKERAEKFLDKTVKLTLKEESLNISEKELIKIVSSREGFAQEEISRLATNLSSGFNKLPQNASFRFSEGKVTLFKPAKDGLTVDEEKFKKEFKLLLEQIENDKTNNYLLAIPFARIPPQIKTGDVNNLGLKELLGKGQSFFRGSISSRIHNIVLASSRLNGLLIPPGETFSFNRSLGEVSQATGYKEAYIIKEGRTILGDGGGVCQVSTTLFRALLSAGLPIEERLAHAYRVSYYEQGFPPGLDATVWESTADLKFKNDTPAYILIQSSINTKTKTLIFELYGTADGRISTISDSRVWDQIPPPPDLYQDDPTQPTGTIKQIDFKAWGAKVAFDWRVERAGEVLQERTFYSFYRPWQAVYLRGTRPSQ